MRIRSRGVGLIAAATAGLAAGFTFGYPELALLGAAAALAVLAAAAYVFWQPRLQAVRAADPDRVGRGESSTVTLTVRNRDRLRSVNLVAQDRCGGRPVPVPLLRLRPGRDTTVRYPAPTQRRGVVLIGPLRVSRRDPLGLIRLARNHAGTTEVWVHPRLHPLTAVPTGITRSMDGRFDRVPHGSITFDSLREYVVGDELRRVHWRTSARVGELMVREDLDTSLPRLVVLLDNRADAHPQLIDGVAESFEAACEAAASVAAAAAREELPVALLFVADLSDGDDHLHRLAAVELQPEPRGADLLQNAVLRLRQQRLGDTLVFLTGPGAMDQVGRIGVLRGPYPSVVVGLFGAETVQAGIEGVVVINAADGAEFATEWNGVRRW
ncbi:MAG TPA: DUF58 domain-containing protein [Micromonosporaceae bacterium]|nr:DUF58 domain-containing protein [Micromonosporaceae bacterium]